MKYYININQKAIIDNNLNIKGTSLETWVLLDFLLFFQNADNLKKICVKGVGDFIWINYKFLNEQIALCNFYKQNITKHLKLLQQLELIDLYHTKDHSVYFRILPTIECLFIDNSAVCRKTNSSGKNNEQHLCKIMNSTRIYKNQEYINNKKDSKKVDFENQNLESVDSYQSTDELASNNQNEINASYKPIGSDIDSTSSQESLENTESLADSVLESAAAHSDEIQTEEHETTNVCENEPETPQESKNDNQLIPTPIPMNKKALKANSKALSKIEQENQLESEFTLFWNLYPKSQSKINAKRAFINLRLGKHRTHSKIKVPFDNILNALSELLAKIAREGTPEKWIPYASSWLNSNDFMDNEVNNNNKLPQDSKECMQEVKEMLMRMADKMNEKFKENPNFKTNQEYPIIKREILLTCVLKIKEICKKYHCSFYKYYGFYPDDLSKEELKYRWYLCKSFHEWLKESLNG